MLKIKKPVLYSPAGNILKAYTAFYFGADGVYIGSNKFGLRKSEEISYDKLKNLLEYFHKNNKKVDITLNAYLKDYEIDQFNKYFVDIIKLKPDSIIISDPVVIILYEELKEKLRIEYVNKLDIANLPSLTLSTQANATNFISMKFWNRQGIKRIVSARELSLKELYNIKKRQIEENLNFEIEIFIHGAMCVSISGRCLLSLYMTNKKLSNKGTDNPRDANKGECVHPCRFAYLVEKTRENEFFPIEEDDRYSYILSSKDLCLLRYLPLFMYANIDAFKIEGRMKSAFYAATTTLAYRKAIDKAYEIFKNIEINEETFFEYLKDPEKFVLSYPKWNSFTENLKIYTELASHRPYTTGFYFDNENPDYMMPLYESKLIQKYILFGEYYPNSFYENNIIGNNFGDNYKFNSNSDFNLNYNQILFFAKNSFNLNNISLYIFSIDGIKKLNNFSILDLNKTKTNLIQHSKFYILQFDADEFINKNQIFFLFTDFIK